MISIRNKICLTDYHFHFDLRDGNVFVMQLYWNLDTRASSGLWLLYRESDNPLAGPTNQCRQRIVKWEYEKQMNSLKSPLMHIIRSRAAPVNGKLRGLAIK